MPIEKRSKEEKAKSARKVREAIYSTPASHGKPGAWGKEPGTFEVEVLEPELEIVAVIPEETPVEAVKKDIERRALEAEIEVKEQLEESQEETVAEEVAEPIVEEAVAEPLEAVAEDVIAVRATSTDLPQADFSHEDEARKAEIARQTDPCLLAKSFLEGDDYLYVAGDRLGKHETFYRLRRWRGEYYFWKDGCYRPVSDDTVKGGFYLKKKSIF